MLNNIEAAIFDMDGTLIDSMWVWHQIDIEYLKRYGYEYSDEFRKEFEGMNFYDTAVYFQNRFNINESVETIINDWLHMSYEKYRDEVEFKPGALEYINFLRDKGIKTGIATSNSRELVDMYLETHNATGYFDFVATSTEIKASKPEPDLYLHVAKNLNVKPERCLVFEDVPNGILGGQNANMKTVSVYDKYSEYVEDKKRELADYYITSYYDLINGED